MPVRRRPEVEFWHENPVTLVDTQINAGMYGGWCVDLAAANLRRAKIHRYYQSCFAQGVFPCSTFITQEWDQLLWNMEQTAEYCLSFGMPPHFHVEGPFFMPVDGYIGAHPKTECKKASIRRLRLMQKAAKGMIRILTVGADVPGIVAVIRAAVKMGMVVSLGHTNATPEQVFAAVEAGATEVTHFGNGQPRMVPRNGLTDVYLATPRLKISIISDRTHVPDHTIVAVLRSKGSDNVMVISDRSARGGAKVRPNPYDLWGSKVWAKNNGDTVMLVGENGLFAGGWEMLHPCVNNFAALAQEISVPSHPMHLPLTEEDVFNVCVRNPWRRLGLTVAEGHALGQRLGIRPTRFANWRFDLQNAE